MSTQKQSPVEEQKAEIKKETVKKIQAQALNEQEQEKLSAAKMPSKQKPILLSKKDPFSWNQMNQN